MRFARPSNTWIVLTVSGLSGVGLFYWLNPELANDPKFQKDFGEVCFYLVMVTSIGRSIGRQLSAKAPPKAPELPIPPESERSKRWTHLAGIVAVALVASLGTVYFLVRFVKWAWTD